MENGKLKLYDEPCFSKLPAKPKNKIYKHCLELNKPNVWQAYNNILENGLNFENWLEIRNFFLNGILSKTIWQKCEAIYCAANNVESKLEGHFNTENKKIPTLNDINNSILLSKQDFETLLFSYKNIENALIVNF